MGMRVMGGEYMQMEVEQLRIENERLTNALAHERERCAEECAWLREQNANLHRETERLRVASDRVEPLTVEKDRFRAEAARLSEQVAELEQKRRSLTSELEDTRYEAAGLQKRLQRLAHALDTERAERAGIDRLQPLSSVHHRLLQHVAAAGGSSELSPSQALVPRAPSASPAPRQVAFMADEQLAETPSQATNGQREQEQVSGNRTSLAKEDPTGIHESYSSKQQLTAEMTKAVKATRLFRIDDDTLKLMAADRKMLELDAEKLGYDVVKPGSVPQWFHFSGLCDEIDEHILRISLFLAAGKPEAHQPPKPFEKTDRGTWIWEALAAKDMVELTKLQPFAGHGYKCMLRMPISIMPITEGTANNMLPFGMHIFAADKSTLLGSKERSEFRLLTTAFDSGNSRNSRQQLQLLKQIMLGLHPLTGAPTGWKVGEREVDAFKMHSSPINAVTLPDQARVKANVPMSAKFYAFCYPYAVDTMFDDKVREMKINMEDAFVNWIINGAFIYFDFKYDIVAVNALSFTSKAESATITFADATPLPLSAIQPLADLKRWMPISVDLLKDTFNFTHYAWVIPSEFLGDHIFSQSGGFAFLHKDDVQRVEYKISVKGEMVMRGDERFETTEGIKVHKEGPRGEIQSNHPLAMHTIAVDVKRTAEGHVIADRTDSRFESPDGNVETIYPGPEEGEVLVTLTTTTKSHTKSLFYPVMPNDPLIDDVTQPLIDAKTATTRRVRISKVEGKYEKNTHGEQIFVEGLKDLCDDPKDNAKFSKALAIVDGLRRESDAHLRMFHPIEYTAPLHIDEMSSKAYFGNSELVLSDKFANVSVAHYADGKIAAIGILKLLEVSPESLFSQCGQPSDEILWPPGRDVPDSDERARYDKLDQKTKAILHESLGVTAAVIDELVRVNALWLLKGQSSEDFAKEVRENARYVILQTCKGDQVMGNDGHVIRRDPGRDENYDLNTFHDAVDSKTARLELHEVAALRLYTSSSFRVINGPARLKLTQKTKPKHPTPALIVSISDGLKKLRANNMQTKIFRPRYLWRGMRNLQVGTSFMLDGGTELACMSTSSNLDIVAKYADSKAPLLLRLRVDSPMEMGADISWLSIFPGEKEVLYPPLTFLKPLFQQAISGTAGVVVTVKPAFPS